MAHPVPDTDSVPRWIVLLGSAALALHLGALGVAVLAAPSGPWPTGEGVNMIDPPRFAYDLNRKLAHPYLQAVKLAHTYHFPSNRPGMADVYFELRLKDDQGQPLETVRFPDPNANAWVRHRQQLFARQLGTDQPVMPPAGEAIPAPGQEVRDVTILEQVDPHTLRLKTVKAHLVPRDHPVFAPTDWEMLLAKSYVRYACRTHGAAAAEFVRHYREPFGPGVMADEPPPPTSTEDLITLLGEMPR